MILCVAGCACLAFLLPAEGSPEEVTWSIADLFGISPEIVVVQMFEEFFNVFFTTGFPSVWVETKVNLYCQDVFVLR